jgi:hypothetical protein
MNPILLYYKYKWLLPESLRSRIRSMRPGRHLSEQAAQIQGQLFQQLGGCVASGPFAGMRYIEEATGSAICPKIVGTYERELAELVRSACDSNYAQIIDIGAAEGYYAVGLALRCPDARVTAFELTERGRDLLTKTAIANGKGPDGNLLVQGECTVETLSRTLAGRNQGPLGTGRLLILCDAEGAEVDLLDPVQVPPLRTADLLVEVHDCLRPRVRETLRSRFLPTHNIRHILSRRRRISDCPVPRLPREVALAAMWENRSAKAEWFWMTPKPRTGSSGPPTSPPIQP